MQSAMHKYKCVRALSDSTAAYIAGLIDGEGTITLSRHHATENRRIVVSVANTELQLLRFLLGEIGAGPITRKRTTSDRHTPSFCYVVWSRQAMDLLRQVTPFLRSYKRKRAEIALNSYTLLTPRNGKYTAALLEQRCAFEKEFFAIASGQRHQCPKALEPVAHYVIQPVN
jgi:hypothetical protein